MSRPVDRPSIYSRILSFVVSLSFFLPVIQASHWIQYPPSGYATMTHYTLPPGFIAACGCTPNSTYYPTAALNQFAYGSSTSFGPGCGQCFKLTLVDAFTANPPFYANTTRSVVVKITDLCPDPAKSGWCNATKSSPNGGGAYLNFDLAWPSTSIGANFFPSNVVLYGFADFGVWNVSYESVSCQEWDGYTNQTALGDVSALGYTSCCPNNPAIDGNLCPSYSDNAGIPPDKHPASGADTIFTHIPHILFLTLAVSLSRYLL